MCTENTKKKKKGYQLIAPNKRAQTHQKAKQVFKTIQVVREHGASRNNGKCWERKFLSVNFSSQLYKALKPKATTYRDHSQALLSISDPKIYDSKLEPWYSSVTEPGLQEKAHALNQPQPGSREPRPHKQLGTLSRSQRETELKRSWTRDMLQFWDQFSSTLSIYSSPPTFWKAGKVFPDLSFC